MKVTLRPNGNKDNELYKALVQNSSPDQLDVELGNSFLGEIPTPVVDQLFLDGVEVDGITGARS